MEKNTYKIKFFLLLFFIFCSAILGDSAAEALLLANYPAKVIPLMYIVNAFFLFVFSLFLMSAIDRVDRGKLFLNFLFIHAIIVFIIWGTVLLGIKALFIPLFSYSYITKIFIFLLFWTLANDLVDSRKAGKDFPFIAAGGTIGAIGISFAIPWILKVISAKNLLLIWSLFSVILGFSFLPVKKKFSRNFLPTADRAGSRNVSVKSVLQDLFFVMKEPLLSNMSILYFLLFFILLNQHYTFYTALKSRYKEAASLASFLGYFNGISMALTFILQISLSGYLLRKIGSTRSMLLMPLAFTAIFSVLVFQSVNPTLQGSINMTLYGSVALYMFWFLVAGVGIRIAFFDSFFSPNFQIFFSSLPHDIRGRGKLVIEGVIKPLAMVSASGWIFLITPKLTFSNNMIVLLIASILMVFIAIRLRSKYTESLTEYLGSFRTKIIQSDEIEMGSDIDLDTLPQIEARLRSEETEIKLFLVSQLARMNEPKAIDIISDFYHEADIEVKAGIIRAFTGKTDKKLKDIFELAFNHKDSELFALSLPALAAFGEEKIFYEIKGCVRDDNPMVSSEAINALWSMSGKSDRNVFVSILGKLIFSDNSHSVICGLNALKNKRDELAIVALFEKFLREREELYLKDRAVWETFLSVASSGISHKATAVLLSLSPSLGAKKRKDITDTIIQISKNGYEIFKMKGVLKDGDPVHRLILLDVLIAILKSPDNETAKLLRKLAQKEANSAYEVLETLEVLKRRDIEPAVDLLKNAVKEELLDIHVGNIIRIAALLDESDRVMSVMHRLDHENEHIRARALEVFDNCGDVAVNRLAIKLLDNINFESGYARKSKSSIVTVVQKYLNNSNPWLRLCAEYATASI